MTIEDMEVYKTKVKESERLLTTIQEIDYIIKGLSGEYSDFKIYYIDDCHTDNCISHAQIGIPGNIFDRVIANGIMGSLLDLKNEYQKAFDEL